jgi:hypothetical protein
MQYWPRLDLMEVAPSSYGVLRMWFLERGSDPREVRLRVVYSKALWSGPIRSAIGARASTSSP